MTLEFTVHGHSCDLALHPVSRRTSELVKTRGFDVYSAAPLEWWRKGKTSTWGMKVDENCFINILLDGKPVPFNASEVIKNPLQIRRRMYLESKARYLCVLGFDNELCRFTWRWEDVNEFDADKLEFMVHQWDRIMNASNYFILDEILYDGHFANRHDQCQASGFTLLEPRIIDLNEVRQELGLELK